MINGSLTTDTNPDVVIPTTTTPIRGIANIGLMDSEYKQITEEALKGGFKADAGKSMVGLIPPEVLLDLGDLYAKGAKKYSPNNWRLGMDFQRVYDALLRHLFKWWGGEEIDPIDGQHHLTSVLWNAVALRYYMIHYETYSEFDSRYTEPERATEGNQK